MVADSVMKQLDGLKAVPETRVAVRRFLSDGLEQAGPAGGRHAATQEIRCMAVQRFALSPRQRGHIACLAPDAAGPHEGDGLALAALPYTVCIILIAMTVVLSYLAVQDMTF